MEIFSVIIQFFDFLISSGVSLINIVRYLWREILLGAFILILCLILIHILRAVKMRKAFVKALKLAAKENGVKLHFSRPPIFSLFYNFDGYDIEFDLRGKRYRIKFAPLITLGVGVHLASGHEAVYLGRLANRRALSKGIVRGISVKLKYDVSNDENTVNVMLFSPTPIAVTEKRANGTVWELDTENGEDVGGILVFTDAILIHRLPRLIDGYIETLIHIDE